jgi:hypothetical protein
VSLIAAQASAQHVDQYHGVGSGVDYPVWFPGQKFFGRGAIAGLFAMATPTRWEPDRSFTFV